MGAFTVYAIKKEFYHVERYEIIENGIREHENSIFSVGVTTNDHPRIRAYLSKKNEELKLITRSGSQVPIYYRDSSAENPWWKSFWEIPEKLYNRSVDILVIIELKKTLFVIVHGHARYFINPLSIIYDFGLRTALNLVDENMLKSAETFVPSEIGMRTKKQPGKMTSIESYDINVLNTLLKQVGGFVKAHYQEYFKTVEGADSIRFNFKGTQSQLYNVLLDFYNIYTKKDYINKGFEWIDNFRPIRDKKILIQLNKVLAERIMSGSDDVSLIFPEIFGGTVLPNFSYRGISRRQADHFYPHLDFISQYFPVIERYCSDSVDEELLKHHRVIAVDVNNENKRLSSYSVFQCIYCELDYNSHLYMLEGGIWYLVDDDFNERLDLSIGSLLLNRWDCGIYYINHKIREVAEQRAVSKELIFNELLTNELNRRGSAELLDTKLVSYQKSRIEICDVIFRGERNNIMLIHNKYKYGSSALSHLFSQGYISANLITEKNFRKSANDKILKKELKFPEDDGIERGIYTIVYGIIGRRNKNGQITLPLFSRINLDIAKQNLERLGFPMRLSFIEDKRTLQEA